MFLRLQLARSLPKQTAAALFSVFVPETQKHEEKKAKERKGNVFTSRDSPVAPSGCAGNPGKAAQPRGIRNGRELAKLARRQELAASERLAQRLVGMPVGSCGWG